MLKRCLLFTEIRTFFWENQHVWNYESEEDMPMILFSLNCDPLFVVFTVKSAQA